MRWRVGMLVLVGLAAGLNSLSAAAPSADEVFAKFQQAYQANKNFAAEFEETTLQQNYKSETQGRLFFAKPNLLRKEYVDQADPKRITQLIVLDGKHAWSYTPVLNQVNKARQGQEGAGILPGVGASFEHLKAHYTLKLVEDEPARKKGVYHLALSPKQPSNFQETIEVWIRSEDWLPIQFSYQTVGQPGGDIVAIISLKNIKVNQPLPEDTFRFVIPEGAEVISVSPPEG